MLTSLVRRKSFQKVLKIFLCLESLKKEKGRATVGKTWAKKKPGQDWKRTLNANKEANSGLKDPS